jgi:hypothetical protein
MFGVVAVIFAYTTIVNIVERPEGVQVASFFIGAILVVSLLSRVNRAFELRATSLEFDETATEFIAEAAAEGNIEIVAHDPHSVGIEETEPSGVRRWSEYDEKAVQQRADSRLGANVHIIFLEVNVTDSSEFATDLLVHGRRRGDHRVLWVDSPAVPNSIAAILLHIRDETGTVPNVYFQWSEGNPLLNLLRFLFIGMGEVAPVTREVLRRAEPAVPDRPKVHIG